MKSKRSTANHSTGASVESDDVSGIGGAADDQRLQKKRVGDDSEEIPLSVVCEILQNERRRKALEYLDHQDRALTTGELAEHLAAIENDKPEAQVTSKERKRLYVNIYQNHLPRMDDAGAVDFDSDRGTITPTDETEVFVHYLSLNESAVAAPTTRWPLYYLAVAAAIVGVFLSSLAGLSPAAFTTPLVVAGGTMAVGVCALGHHASVREGSVLSRE